jgi:hypothetical protein
VDGGGSGLPYGPGGLGSLPGEKEGGGREASVKKKKKKRYKRYARACLNQRRDLNPKH